MPNERRLLRRIISATIAEALDEGVTTSGLVAERVMERNTELVRSLMSDLAERFVRRETSGQMKKMSKGVYKLAANLFADLDGLPAALSFEERGVRLFVKRSRARKVHFTRHLRFLRKQIQADEKRCRLVELADERLDVLRARHGDLPEEQLLMKEYGE